MSLEQLAQESYAATKAALKSAKGPADLKRLAKHLHDRVNGLLTEGLTYTKASIACCSGCHYCCYLKVDAQAREVFQIVDYIRQHFTQDEIANIQERADENRKKIAAMTANQHFAANLPCALLKDGKCSVYPVRPFQCRAFHAQRVETCKASFEQPERPDLPHSQIPQIKLVLTMFIEGANQAYRDAGYDDRPYDLNAALHAALSDSRCEKRWRNKISAFPRTAVAKDLAEAGED